jgi:alpha-1,2-mannosyltransferase
MNATVLKQVLRTPLALRRSGSTYQGVRSQTRTLPWNRTLAVVGVVAFAASVIARVAVANRHPESQWTMLDLSVYADAGKSLQHHQGILYSTRFGLFPLPYIYPPFCAYVFHFLHGVSFDSLQLGMATVSVVSLVLVVWACLGLLGYRRTAGRVGLTLALAAGCLWLEPVIATLNFGQVNLLVLALTVADLGLSDRRWFKGVGIGVAIGIKLTPAIFVVYLLVTRRFRAAAVAVAAFAATALGTWVLLPRDSKQFWFHSIGVTPVGKDFVSNQSVQGTLLRFLNNSDSASKLPWLLASMLLAVAGLMAAAFAAKRGAELLAVTIVGVTGLAVSPISWTAHWVWFVPLGILLLDQAFRARRRVAAVTAVAVGYLALLAWPLRIDGTGATDSHLPLIPTGLIWLVPHTGSREETWNPGQMLLGNAYLLLGLVFLAVVVVAEFRRFLAADEPDGSAAGSADTGTSPSGVRADLVG